MRGRNKKRSRWRSRPSSILSKATSSSRAPSIKTLEWDQMRKIQRSGTLKTWLKLGIKNLRESSHPKAKQAVIHSGSRQRLCLTQAPKSTRKRSLSQALARRPSLSKLAARPSRRPTKSTRALAPTTPQIRGLSASIATTTIVKICFRKIRWTLPRLYRLLSNLRAR